METTWGQPPTLKGLSRFLVEHEPCGAGFDVSHPEGLGSGRVSMTCRGCGATYEYATATIEFEREVEFAPVTVRRTPEAQAAPPPPPPPPADPTSAVTATEAAPAITGGPPVTPPSVASPPTAKAKASKASAARIKAPFRKRGPDDNKPGEKKNRSRDRMIAAGLLVLSIIAFAFAIIRVTSNDGEETAAPTATPAPETTSPKPSKPVEDEKPAAKPKPATEKADGGPKATEPKAQTGGASAPATTEGAAEKTVKTARYSIVVPKDWVKRDAGGGALLSPPGDAPVSVQVFYEEDPGMSEQMLSEQTSSFLRSRDPKAKVGSPEDRAVDGNPGFELNAVGPAGVQVALGVLAGPYRYLVIESADPNTPKSVREEADRVLDSFKPR